MVFINLVYRDCCDLRGQCHQKHVPQKEKDTYNRLKLRVNKWWFQIYLGLRCSGWIFKNVFIRSKKNWKFNIDRVLERRKCTVGMKKTYFRWTLLVNPPGAPHIDVFFVNFSSECPVQTSPDVQRRGAEISQTAGYLHHRKAGRRDVPPYSLCIMLYFRFSLIERALQKQWRHIRGPVKLLNCCYCLIYVPVCLSDTHLW